MDPNGFYHNYAMFSESESNISPLHEALRGTMAMPMLDEFVSPTFQPPPYSNSMRNTPPTTNNQLSWKALKGIKKYSHSKNFLQPQSRTTSTHLSKCRFFPWRDPIATVHAHLNTIGGLDDGPIFENPTRLFTGVTSPLGYVSSPLNHYPFGSNTIYTQHIQHGALYNEDLYEPMRSGHICRFCNATFNSPQAYGGHMSHHSNQNKKNLQD
ncbi:hypothetical protein BRADI_2g12671v3 [Brachypodium distachyon]|uniref:C2H2-type domain-containing protein n=1 Tax=Brachypodium distachyon TaxID=15368 RepID=A0A0Q3MIP0_BRADI|nr:hypothetical protein BRADI_2g12671v3 [Brachypodium distachyon]